jgi:hypothetical protein
MWIWVGIMAIPAVLAWALVAPSVVNPAKTSADVNAGCLWSVFIIATLVVVYLWIR